MSQQRPDAPTPQPVPVDPQPVAPKSVTPEPVPSDRIEPIPVPPAPKPVVDEPLSLVDDAELEDGISKVHAISGSLTNIEGHQFLRPLSANGTGATRCRLFHSRIAEAPLDHMQKNINEWIDSGKIEIKHVGHVMGTMSGKSNEANLIVMVWY